MVGKMLMNKRSIDDLRKSSGDNKRACYVGEEETASLISGDLHRDSNPCLSCDPIEEVALNLSRTVVSLALCEGSTVLFACSGIALEAVGSKVKGSNTYFLTSASLVRALNDKEKDHDGLKIEVRFGHHVFTGSLREYDLDHGIAVVKVMAFLDVQRVYLDDVKFLPHSKVVAVGRDISGKLMATVGVLTGESSGSEDSEEPMMSTCKISEVWEGGPLVDFGGNFVGMNLFLAMEGTIFLPTQLINERLEHFITSRLRGKFLELLINLKAVRVGGRSTGDISNSNPHVVVIEDHFGDLDSMGYPKPSKTMLQDDMILVNTFEEPFGDVYCEGVWSEVSKTVSATICQNVVALASFNGETRFFACTGFFIKWDGCATVLTSASLVRSSDCENKINENLRIEVLLPNNEHREGTLQHYNLHYNVALVNIKDFCAVCPVTFQQNIHDCARNVVAVGRCFKSGTLMAKRGRLTDWSGKLDCKFLVHSSCKTTKVGIGGPLVDFNGKFMGMNFYEKKVGTPCLLWKEIRSVLEYLEKKGTVAEVGNDGNRSGAPFWTMDRDSSVCPNSWPVPMPCWCRRDDLEEDESCEFAPDGKMIYGYSRGTKVMYL